MQDVQKQFMPDHIKNQRLQPFLPPPRDKSQSRPTKGGNNKSSKQKTKETQLGPKGFSPQEGKSTGPENKENTRIVDPLKFYKQLCDVEDSLLHVFNKLNDIHYVNGIVNLSRYTLT